MFRSSIFRRLLDEFGVDPNAAFLAQRVKEPQPEVSNRAIAAAKASGQVLGNPRLSDARAVAHGPLRADADADAAAVAPAIRQARPPGEVAS